VRLWHLLLLLLSLLGIGIRIHFVQLFVNHAELELTLLRRQHHEIRVLLNPRLLLRNHAQLLRSESVR
jgi:hypothetical protein